MDWNILKNTQKIVKVFELVISRRIEIEVRIKGEKSPFISRFVKLSPASGQTIDPECSEKKRTLIIEKLIPDLGNDLIQASRDVVIEFTVEDRLFKFDIIYTGVSSDYPYFGFIVSFPEFIWVKDTRRDERISLKVPEFVSVEFRLSKGSENDKMYKLDLTDYSKRGLGMVITGKDSELLQILKPGTIIRDVTFFASWTVITVNAKVIHVTKMEEGKYKGQYSIGLESSEIINSARLPEKEIQ